MCQDWALGCEANIRTVHTISSIDTTSSNLAEKGFNLSVEEDRFTLPGWGYGCPIIQHTINQITHTQRKFCCWAIRMYMVWIFAPNYSDQYLSLIAFSVRFEHYSYEVYPNEESSLCVTIDDNIILPVNLSVEVVASSNGKWWYQHLLVSNISFKNYNLQVIKFTYEYLIFTKIFRFR